MNFREVLDGAEVLAQSGNPQISGVEYDSRRVKPGDIFVAMRGGSSDGNRFMHQAIAAGAVAVVTDSEAKPKHIAWAQVPHGRRALAILSANYLQHPAKKLAITGITGTNGKSTTAFLMEAVLAASGRRSVLIGTIEYHVGGAVLPAPHTTPEPLELQRLFADAVKTRATEGVMEVSSHALAQERTYGITFDVAVFTNLTRDHLDYHQTMGEYFVAKRRLFDENGGNKPRVVVLNADDEYGLQLVEYCKDRGDTVFTYGLREGDFRAEKTELTPAGVRFSIVSPAGTIPVASRLIGKVNLYNILAASAAGHARGCTAAEIQSGICRLARVPGRFERVDCGQPFTVVVDYAHTDDALRNLTLLARDLVKTNNGRVITVFGCGGDRDRSKRPLMGDAAGNGSDFVVLTSDNPRSEDPLAIINDAVVGVQRSGVKYTTEVDRRAAIHLAISRASAGDIVLIAGKGHEKMQITAKGTIPFDDTKVAAEALADAGYKLSQATERAEA